MHQCFRISFPLDFLWPHRVTLPARPIVHDAKYLRPGAPPGLLNNCPILAHRQFHKSLAAYISKMGIPYVGMVSTADYWLSTHGNPSSQTHFALLSFALLVSFGPRSLASGSAHFVTTSPAGKMYRDRHERTKCAYRVLLGPSLPCLPLSGHPFKCVRLARCFSLGFQLTLKPYSHGATGYQSARPFQWAIDPGFKQLFRTLPGSLASSIYGTCSGVSIAAVRARLALTV